MVISWCMPWGQMKWLRDYDDAVARKAFDKATSYVVGGPVPNYAVTPVKMYPSFETYISTLPALAGTVCYDLENWDASPEVEKEDPWLAMRDFGLLAKRQGQVMMAAPSRDLVQNPSLKGGSQGPKEDINDAYLRLGIPSCAAGSDIYLVQSQGAQKDPAVFANLINGAIAQVPSGQVVWGGLTTAFATSTQMIEAFEAVTVAGFWVTIDQPAHAPIAADFLRTVIS